MKCGAGYLAARKYVAARIIDPRTFAVHSIKDTFARYPHIKKVVPAMGYGRAQIQDLKETINTAKSDLVIFATPIHLARLIPIDGVVKISIYCVVYVGMIQDILPVWS